MRILNYCASSFLVLSVLLGVSNVSRAHFVWLNSVEEDGKTKALLYFSESADLQDYRLPKKIAEASVWQRGADKEFRKLKMVKVETDERVGLEADLEKSEKAVLAATCNYGIYGGSLLSYYTKHIRSSHVNELGAAGPVKKLQLDIVPRVLEGQIELTVLWKGNPKAEVEVEVSESEEESHSLTTDDQGRARYRPTKADLVGVRANFIEKKATGELDGEEYEGAAHYATLTFRIDSLDEFPKSSESAGTPIVSAIPASDIPELPEGLASFGGAVHDGWLYVYSGHIGGAHDHSRENLSQRFQRIKLAGGTSWEQLPMQTPLQGLALVSHKTGLYRIGGLNARNAPEEDEDLHSSVEFARFDPIAKKWTSLADLPNPRSSHDAVVIEDKLYVAGGWTLAGDGDGTWLDEAVVFDLHNPGGNWKPLPKAPFMRRALAVSHWQGQLVVLGGIDSEGDISFAVNLFDPETQAWTLGPELPWQGMEGFGVSAWNLEGRLYVSGLADDVYRLSVDGQSWKKVVSLKIPRFFHQLLPLDPESLIAVAGASRRGHLSHIEKLSVLDKTTEPRETADDAAEAKVVPVSTNSSEAQESRIKPAVHALSADDSASNWPGFRGTGNSVTTATNLPTSWSDEQGIAWRAPLPGYGQSSPIVWGGKVFVTTMQGDMKQTPTVLCIDLSDGKEQWRREFVSSQEIVASDYVTRGSPTPVADANGVYAFFESGELVALDHEGNMLWQRSLVDDYGAFQGNHGVGSSLAATDDAVIVLVNHDGPSYLLAVDKNKGQNLWKVDYEKRVAWSSPAVTKRDGKTIAVVSAGGIVEAYDTASGERLWQVDNLPGNNVPSATIGKELVFIGAKDQSSNVAIRFSSTASDTAPEISWRSEKASSSFSSPLFHQGLVYYVNRSGVAFCVDASSGELLWKERLGESCWASPLAAEDRIYFFTKSGPTIVTSAGRTYELLAENPLSIDPKTRIYGVAAVTGKLILRTGEQLICIGS